MKMKSGQYKVSHARSSESLDRLVPKGGQFRLNSRDFHPLTLVESSYKEFPHFNSLLITASKRDVTKASHHHSCENVGKPRTAAAAVTKVEQKVRSFLMRGESKPKGDRVFDNEDGWQVGRIVTVPRKSKLSPALSYSALHTLPNSSSDTASCLSASSGYSSSSSSSYGSFKSSGSVCSTLPHQRDGSLTRPSPPPRKRMIAYDNPLYDITPASALRFKQLTDASPIYDLPPDASLLSGSSSEGFIEEDPWSSTLPYQDPIARECREYFERRVRSSETLRKRWSITPAEATEEPEPEPFVVPEVDDFLTEDDDNPLIHKHVMIVPTDHVQSMARSSSYDNNSSNTKRTAIDEKMEFLRSEIASLMQQDNRLFKQLLALHDSISALKVQNALGHTHALRPLTPASLDSFTEEEEEDEDDDEGDGEGDAVENEDKVEKNVKREKGNNLKLIIPTTPRKEDEELDEEEDEGHGTDLSLNNTPSDTSSPASTLSSHSSHSSFSKSQVDSRDIFDTSPKSTTVGFTRSRKSYAPTAKNRQRSSSVHIPKTAPPPVIHCGAATALVIVHTDDEEALLKSTILSKSNTFSPTSYVDTIASPSYICRALSIGSTPKSAPPLLSVSKDKKLQRNSKRTTSTSASKLSLTSCSGETSSASSGSMKQISLRPFREALIM